MGNRLAVIEIEDCEIPSFLKTFFTRLNLKWVEYFSSKIKEQLLLGFQLNSSDTRLAWKDFFSIFAEIRNLSEKEELSNVRLSWHPATLGYAMKSVAIEYLPHEEVIATIPDDYTEDEPSEISENPFIDETLSTTADEKNDYDQDINNNSLRGKVLSSVKERGAEEQDPSTSEEYRSQRSSAYEDSEKRQSDPSQSSSRVFQSDTNTPKIKGWDPFICNPIFYGYAMTTSNELEKIKIENEIKSVEAEKAAVQRVKSTRMSALTELEAGIKSREANRLKKIDEVFKRYETSKKKRQDDLNRNKKNLPEAAFKVFKVFF